ncbi:MAG TPA: hypothetical protein VG406_22570 [Isosphaeraceae bacterium]|jgi:uncharacterized protein YxjI|nr:hypothetical protein [Isosphaeraceae bacterium]
MDTTIPELFLHERFVARKKLFKVFGAAFHIYAEDGRLLAYSKQKAFKLKEDIRVYSDEEMNDELLFIQADRVIDFSASYSVIDSRTGEHVGTLRRKGWSSLFRDSWEILDAQGIPRGRVLEDSSWKALLRRTVDWASLFLPQAFRLEVDGKPVATMKQNFLAIPPKFFVDLGEDSDDRLPRPLAVATVVLLLAIEGRQG